MKAIFLDIDGVLNNSDFFIRQRRVHILEEFAPENIFWVKKLIEETNAKVILSSSWRSEWVKGKGFDLKLASEGINIEDITPITYKNRGYEIKKHLSRHPEITNFIIIDDDNDMGLLKHRLIKTDSKTGFIEKDYIKALKLFEKGLKNNGR